MSYFSKDCMFYKYLAAMQHLLTETGDKNQKASNLNRFSNYLI